MRLLGNSLIHKSSALKSGEFYSSIWAPAKVIALSSVSHLMINLFIGLAQLPHLVRTVMQLLLYRKPGFLSDIWSNKGLDRRKHSCESTPHMSTQAYKDYSSG